MPTPKGDKAGDLKPFQGAWLATQLVILQGGGGAKLVFPAGEEPQITITGDKMNCKGLTDLEGESRLELSSDKRELTIVPKDGVLKGKTLKTTAVFDGDRLELRDLAIDLPDGTHKVLKIVLNKTK